MKQIPEIKYLKPVNIIYAYTDNGYPKERFILSEIWDDMGYIIGYSITTSGKVHHHDLDDLSWESTEYSEEELVSLAVNNKFPKYLSEFILEYFIGTVKYLAKRKEYQIDFIHKFCETNNREPTNEEIDIWKIGYDKGRMANFVIS